jgi:hypothetical protein
MAHSLPLCIAVARYKDIDAVAAAVASERW